MSKVDTALALYEIYKALGGEGEIEGSAVNTPSLLLAISELVGGGGGGAGGSLWCSGESGQSGGGAIVTANLKTFAVSNPISFISATSFASPPKYKFKSTF